MGAEPAAFSAEHEEILLWNGAEVLKHIGNRHASHSRWGKGPLTAARVVAVDHASVLMGGDGDAAINMADDEVQLLIGVSQLFRMALCRFLDTQRMRNGMPVDAADACNPGQIRELVDDRGIERQDASAIFFLHLTGKLHAEIGHMIETALLELCILNHLIIDFIDAAGHGVGTAATADNGIKAGKIQMVVPDKLPYDLVAIRKLIVDGVKGLQYGGIMEDVFAGGDLISIVIGQLCRCGALID